MAVLSHQAIVEMGRYRDLSLKGVDPQIARSLYYSMVRLRRCEEALIREYHPADEMRCPVHFCVGQEAVSSALSILLRKEDHLFSHHRSHGYFLAKGAPMRALFAELYGRETGANGGKAGSQDISYHEVNFASGAILVGAAAIATGVAFAAKLRGTDTIAVAGFGESATDEGAFWEAVNYAAVRRLPLVFTCENNHYSTFSPQSKRQVGDNISERVASFGVQARSLFGNDVVAVYQAVSDAVRRARAGEGPSFIEAYTYRWNGHVGPGDDSEQGYRSPEEIEAWKANCPILLLEEKMVAAGLLTPAEKERLVAEIDREIEDAFEFAKSSPFPRSADWTRLNYSTESPLADRLLCDNTHSEFDHDQQYAIPGPY